MASQERAAGAELTQLELVDPTGAATGTAEKLTAHQPPRAAPGVLGVALRRGGPDAAPASRPTQVSSSREKLGVTPTALVKAGVVSYHRTDPICGLVEKEYNHLLFGRVRPTLRPDPDEVGDVFFVTPAELESRSAAADFSARFPTILKAARSCI